MRAAPISPLPPAIPIPDTAAGRELAWILEQVERRADGLTERTLERHIAPTYLAALPAADLITIIRDYAGPAGPFTIGRFEGEVTETRAIAIVVNSLGRIWRIRLNVEDQDPNRIDGLFFEPVGEQSLPDSPPTTWPRLEEAVRALAPRVSFAVAELTESGPRWISRLHGQNQRAIASLFKIYVLGEAARQDVAGLISWDDPLEISVSYRSLPNGNLRLAEPGTPFPIRAFAEQMISASDNTATDHLIGLLGREHVEAAFGLMGHSDATANAPLLLTREWFAMRMKMRDTQVERYLDADRDKRRRILRNTVDPLADALSETDPWPGPRYIDSVEWFAGASDVIHALDWLRQRTEPAGAGPVASALSLNPGICWHPGLWSWVGYKGGYETGVMSNAWLLRRQDGRWFAIAGIINDTRREIDAARFWQLLAVAERLLALGEISSG